MMSPMRMTLPIRIAAPIRTIALLRLLTLIFVLAGCCGALKASAQNAGNTAEAPVAREPGRPVIAPSTAQPAATQAEGAGAANTEEGFVFRADVQEVALHATVFDEHKRPVIDLGREDFRVFDDGRPQSIRSFRREDIPVAMAIVIDNSGSMREKRPRVNAAALNLVRASNPQDQVCVVNFNNDSYLDQDYTGDVSLLKDALEHIESRGGTALYDALVATSQHLMKSAKLQKKVILIVTDGEDTASHDSLEEAVRALAVDGGPAVYSIGLLGDEKAKKARRALHILSEQTGGAAFFPSEVSEVEAISQQIAHDIRNQYTIGYAPSTPMVEGAYHQVMVRAQAAGHKGLLVRTRSGYYVTGGQAAGVSR